MLLFTKDPTDSYPEFKEYTKEELFEQYSDQNMVPDVIQQYIDELESKIYTLYKMAKEIKSLQEIECILDSDQKLRLLHLNIDLIKNLTKNRL